MKHPYAALSLGLALASLGFSATAASAAGPTGYWLKEDGAAKMKIESCGAGQLCSRIVWLRSPNDSRGRPLHDARNKNPALRGRPIIGLSIFRGLTPDGANTWGGQIYNPEDGGTYKATLTLVSSNELVLKGCLALFLCGQKTWTRTTFTPPEPAHPKEIEVKADTKPDAPAPHVQDARAQDAHVPDAHVQEVKAPEPEAKPEKPRAIAASLGGTPFNFAHVSDTVLPITSHDVNAGFGMVLTSVALKTPAVDQSDPSKMYLTGILPPQPAQSSADRNASAVAAPAPVPAPSHAAVNEAATHAASAAHDPAETDSITVDQSTQTAAQTVPMPDQRPAELDEVAEADMLASQPHLTWRERRRLRRLERQLPWLQPQPVVTQTAVESSAAGQ